MLTWLQIAWVASCVAEHDTTAATALTDHTAQSKSKYDADMEPDANAIRGKFDHTRPGDLADLANRLSIC